MIPSPASTLGSMLDTGAQLLGGLGQDSALVDVVRAGFLDINLLAGLERMQRQGGVPVVGRGDADGVDGIVFEKFSEILEPFHLVRIGQFVRSFLQVFRVDIADGDHFAKIGEAAERFAVASPLTPHADDRVAHFSPFGETGFGSAEKESAGGYAGACGFHEIAACFQRHGWVLLTIG